MKLLTFAALAACTLSGTAAPEWKEVYDPLVVRTLHLQVAAVDWDRVRFDQPQEGQTESQERASAWFHGEGEDPIQVEIRRKGASDPALPSSADPQKISLKIDINALVPGQRWHGLRKLSLEIGGTEGPLQEGIAWQIHRMAADAGFYRYDAANAAWVKLYINGTYNGVFLSTEQRDEQMLRNRDLYSPYNTWLYKIDAGTFNEVGEGSSPARTHLNFSPFTSTPGGGKPGSGGGGTTPDLDVDLPQWIDMESMLTLAACEAFVENNDGLFTHSGKNSFAADFNPPQLRRRMYFPWDMDSAINNGSRPIYGNGAYQTAILNHPWFGRVYEHTFRELIAGKLSAASLHAFFNQLEPVLAPVLDSDPYTGQSGGAASAFAGLRNWATSRTANVASRFIHPHVDRPAFNHPGGEVISGFGLAMSAPAGEIHFTTDGTDPRLPGGAVAPGALLYSSPVPIDRNVRIMARTRNGTHWSGLASEVSFQIAAYASPLRISEIMYHPLDPDPLDAIDKDAYEFIELHNTGSAALDIGGFFFDGISHVFPAGTKIGAGARMVLVRNAGAFNARYPGAPADGVYLGSLNNSGEKIRLKSPDGTTVISVEYDDDPPWTLSPDGMGYSLVNRNPDGNPDDARNWRASRDPGGSPGTADPEPGHALDIAINEVLAHAEPPFEGAVELHNEGPAGADVGGWFLSDHARGPNGDLDPVLLRKFRLPAGTTIPAGGHAVFYQNAFQSANPLQPFSLNPHGGRVYLSSADTAGDLTGSVIALEFPACAPNASYGRTHTSVGIIDAPLASPSFGVDSPADPADFRTGHGAANAPPRAGPVVISEIMFNPLDTGSEFVELHNISSSPVDLSGWDIDGIANFDFPVGTILPAGGFVILLDTAKTTPEAFRSSFGVPAGVEIFGLLFDLGNAGESLRLDQPNPEPLQPDILIERVRYNDKAPWPTEADGAGPSLERLPPDRFGNEPLHWRALTMHGTPGRLGTATGGLVIAKASSWDARTSPASLGDAWRGLSYNATAWQSADGPSGYGELFLNTLLSYGPDPAAKYPTTYFRKQFAIADDPAAIAGLHLSMLRDDGVVIYLNGTEVARRSMPEGPITYETPATDDHEATAYEDIDLSSFKSLLVRGTNLLAVEVHQVDPASADLVWDGELSYTLSFDSGDQDNDGLPRDWETNNGLDDSNPADAFLDNDGDGQNNTVEFLAGTDPQNASSFFHIATVERTPSGSPVLRWTSVAGKTYRVSYSGDLRQWFGFGAAGEITATGTTCEFTDPGNPLPDQRYYRLEIVP